MSFLRLQLLDKRTNKIGQITGDKTLPCLSRRASRNRPPKRGLASICLQQSVVKHKITKFGESATSLPMKITPCHARLYCAFSQINIYWPGGQYVLQFHCFSTNAIGCAISRDHVCICRKEALLLPAYRYVMGFFSLRSPSIV